MLFALLAISLSPALGFDSRNISDAQWACSPTTAMSVSFAASGGPAAVACGTEVLWAPSQTQPAFAYAFANASALYTLLVLDRDAPNAAEPIRSPLIHMVYADVPGVQLAAGAVTTSTMLFPYSGPRPPAGTFCHRYYVQLYAQADGVSPQLNVDVVGRFTFDFPTWAGQWNLSRVDSAVNFFQTQNDTFRVGPCAGPSPGPQSGAVPAAALGSALALALAAAAAVALLAPSSAAA